MHQSEMWDNKTNKRTLQHVAPTIVENSLSRVNFLVPSHSISDYRTTNETGTPRTSIERQIAQRAIDATLYSRTVTAE
jgi:hypothetical protein